MPSLLRARRDKSSLTLLSQVESVLWFSALAIAFVALAVLSFIILRRLDAIAASIESAGLVKLQLDTLAAQSERMQRQLRDELAQSRAEVAQQAGAARAELGATLNQFTQTLQNQLASVATV